MAAESWSFWLDEAGGLGLPVIAAAAGAVAERATGRVALFDPARPEELAARLLELRDDPGHRQRLAGEPAPVAMAPGDHLPALEALLAAAARGGARPLPRPLADPGELAFEWERREAAFQELLRSEGWEDVIREQREELDRLRPREDEP